MQYEVRKGSHNNYIVTNHQVSGKNNISAVIREIQNFGWRDQKVVIYVNHPESVGIPNDIYRTFSEALDADLVSQCIFINGKTENTVLRCFGNVNEFIDDFEDQPIAKSMIFIAGEDSDCQKELHDYLLETLNPICLEVDLNAILHNVHFYREKTEPKNKVMAMVKANAYGHGLIEVAHYLQDKVDYFGVAYVSEGVTIRREGIHTPIMVMNPALSELNHCVKYDLEPEIYNMSALVQLEKIPEQNKSEIGIHIEIDTGMNRLGFEPEEIDDLIAFLKNTKKIKIQGIYSHLACAEDPQEDRFNKYQHDTFVELAAKIESALKIDSIKHLRNSAGTLRYPHSPTEMIRLGIGIYGVDSNNLYQDQLENTCVLKTEISQIRKVKQGETIGYNRTFTAQQDLMIATIAIGYADGFKRIFSNGVGQVLINGEKVPVVGRVNMDMTMVDVTGRQAEIGDEVIILNRELHPSTLAMKADTIPYEIFTSIGERVGRTYLISF